MIMPKFQLLAALVVVTATSHSILGQEDKAPGTNWTGDGDGKSWSQGSNWSTRHPPTAEEIAETDGADIMVQGVNKEAGLLKFSRTTLTVPADAELRVTGADNRISFLRNESELHVQGKLLLNTAIYFTNSTITVDGSGMIDRETAENQAFLQSNLTLNLVGDKAQINNLLIFGGPAEITVNMTFGPAGINPVNASTLEIGENSTLTVDVSKYKPKSGGTSVALFTFRGIKGKFDTFNVTGGTGKLEYNDEDMTLSEIVVKP